MKVRDTRKGKGMRYKPEMDYYMHTVITYTKRTEVSTKPKKKKAYQGNLLPTPRRLAYRQFQEVNDSTRRGLRSGPVLQHIS